MNVKHGRFLVVALVLAILVAMVAPNVLAQRPVRGQSMALPMISPNGVEDLVVSRKVSLSDAVHYNGLAVEVDGNTEYGFGPVVDACGRFDLVINVYQTDLSRRNTMITVHPVDYPIPLEVYSQNMAEILWDRSSGVVTATSAFVGDPDEPAGLYLRYPAGYLELGETKVFAVEVEGRVFEVRVTRVSCPGDPGYGQTRQIYLPRISTQ